MTETMPERRYIKAEIESLGPHDWMHQPHPGGPYTALRITEKGDPGDEPQSLTFLVPTHQLILATLSSPGANK